jgi:D-3-phosphoglycerate dehydrogenase
MHIVVADDLPASALAVLRQDDWSVDARTGRSLEQLKADLADADALVVRSATTVTAEVIAAAPRLRAIARAGTGVDNVDVAAATARGILVINAPGASSISVAELAMAQVLALARRLPAADASMKAGGWDKARFVGEEVRGKVLGLAGFGRIGRAVARRALAFDMIVIAHDPFVPPAVGESNGVALVSLDELCARADYLSLHLPLTSQTRGMFDAARFAGCKRGVRLINTARGELVDEVALVAAIRECQVGGAAIDVFSCEPTVDLTLQQLPQVIASPHVAASTHEGQERVGLETATALRDYLRTGMARNAVNAPDGPP